VRTTLVFKVQFADGDVKDVPYSLDIFNSIPYEEFCRNKPYLQHLVFPTSSHALKEFYRNINSKPLDGLAAGERVYVDIRFFGDIWYQNLLLPDSDTNLYVTPMTVSVRNRKTVKLTGILTREAVQMTIYDIQSFVYSELDESRMVLVDEDFVADHPMVKLSRGGKAV